MDADDVSYRKSVRNMSLVLAAIVLTVFAALFVPPYFVHPHEAFQASVSENSGQGFTLQLRINSTSVSPASRVLITGWLNSTAGSVSNITAMDSWAVGPRLLWTRACTSGWPIGIGVMSGHFTQDNYTQGALIPISQPLLQCPAQAPPKYFLLEPSSSRALVDIGGSPAYWVLQSTYVFGYDTGGWLPPGHLLSRGVYTVILADEWGDVLITNFSVS